MRRDDPGIAIVYADGSVSAGDERTGVAWIIKGEDGREIARRVKPLSQRLVRRLNGVERTRQGTAARHGALVLMTEYSAALEGIKAARRFGYFHLLLRTDSQPLLADMAGREPVLPPELDGLRLGLRSVEASTDIRAECFKLGQVHDLASTLTATPRVVKPRPLLMQQAHYNDIWQTLNHAQRDLKTTKALLTERLRYDQEPAVFREMEEALVEYEARTRDRLAFIRAMLADYAARQSA